MQAITSPLYDYLLVLAPHEDLYNKVVDIKQDFALKFDHPSATYSKPHMTLLRFMQYEMNERNFINRMRIIVESNPSFKMDLDGFGSFPSHTIYLNVKSKVQFVELVTQLKPVQAFLKLDKEHKPHFITEPHVTIARKLQPWQFEKGWLEYSNTHFTGSFMADKLTLLKRKEDEKHYRVAAQLQLLNKKAAVLQSSLF